MSSARLLLPVFSSALRVSVAALLCILCWAQVPAARVQHAFLLLPEADLLVEARTLRAERRYGEALMVLEDAPVTPEREALRAEILAERQDLRRRVLDFGRGALSGEGDSAEALGGAVLADLFVFGDVRDLLIQGGRAARGEETDEILIALSAAGLVLTLAPSLDLGAAVLKFARRTGALSQSLARQLRELSGRALRQRSVAPLGEALDATTRLSRRHSPLVAMALLRQADEVADLKLAVRFAERPRGAYALWAGGKPALSLLKHGGKGTEALLLRAAGKGRAGLAYAARHSRLLLQPHPLLGLIKAFYKGTLGGLLERWLANYALHLAALALAWLLLESLRLAWRLRRWLSAPRPAPAP